MTVSPPTPDDPRATHEAAATAVLSFSVEMPEQEWRDYMVREYNALAERYEACLNERDFLRGVVAHVVTKGKVGKQSRRRLKAALAGVVRDD